MKFLSRLTKLFSVCLASSIVLVSNSLCFAMEGDAPPTPIVRALSSRSLNALRPNITIGPKHGEQYVLTGIANDQYNIVRGGGLLYTIQAVHSVDGVVIYSLINTDTQGCLFRIYFDGTTYTMKSVARLSPETDYAKLEIRNGEQVISISNAGIWGEIFTVKKQSRLNRYGICYKDTIDQWQEDAGVTVRGNCGDIMPIAFLLAATILR